VIVILLEIAKYALSFLKLFHDFQFVVSLVVTRAVLDKTLPATKLLQTRNTDIIDGLGYRFFFKGSCPFHVS